MKGGVIKAVEKRDPTVTPEVAKALTQRTALRQAQGRQNGSLVDRSSRPSTGSGQAGGRRGRLGSGENNLGSWIEKTCMSTVADR